LWSAFLGLSGTFRDKRKTAIVPVLIFPSYSLGVGNFRVYRLRSDYVEPPMASLKITKRNVDAASKPDKGDAYYWDTELRGFGLRVTKNGVRSYVVQYRLPGRPARRITIGVHGSPWTPERAREKATDILISVKQGDDPAVVAKNRQRAAVDLEFSKYVETFTDGYLKHEWGDTWAHAKRQLEQHVVPHLKGRPLPEIKKHEVSDVIDSLLDRPALARNTHAVLRKLFTWAVNRGDLLASPQAGSDTRRGGGAVEGQREGQRALRLLCADAGRHAPAPLRSLRVALVGAIAGNRDVAARWRAREERGGPSRPAQSPRRLRHQWLGRCAG
jgi:hypothetical protein